MRLGKPYERPKVYAPHCYICRRDTEIVVNDGMFGLCEDCARYESNRIYNKMLKAFEEEEDVSRLAFLQYGCDDLAYTLDEEKSK